MKKLFTMIAVCAATFAITTASAGTFPTHVGKTLTSQTLTAPTVGTSNSSLRAITCDTLTNLHAIDSPRIFLVDTPNEGYFSGNGALSVGGTKFANIGIGEKFTAPAVGMHVKSAFVLFARPTINAGDSSKLVTAYVYDTTGTSLAFNEYAPGNVLDSATVTLKNIAIQGEVVFNFTHAARLSAKGFFVTVALPQTTGDTIVIATNQGTSGNGHGYQEINYMGQKVWASYDSLSSGPVGTYILASVCSGSTGIENLNAGIANLSVYPNPSNGVFTAAMVLETASDVTVSVVDMTGNKVYESIDKSVKEINKHINLSNMAAGVYIMNVRTDKGSTNQRIVIK